MNGAVAADGRWPREARTSVVRASGFQSKADEVVVHLAATAQGRGPGARLGSKDDLRRESGVSVGTFNEALKIAQDRGIVVVRRGQSGGVFAAQRGVLYRLGRELMTLDTTDATVDEAFRVRNALDPLVVEDALLHSTGGDVADLRACLDAMEDAAEAEILAEFVRLTFEYQRRFVDISPNAILRPMFRGALDVIEAHAQPTSTVGGPVTKQGVLNRLALFRRMTTAVETRDRDAALQVMLEATVGWRPTLSAPTEAGNHHTK